MTSKAYPGSCHCGKVQYQIRLKLPPTMEKDVESVRIYKCNCTVCQKMGYFHCRPIKPEEDFILTSPSTIEELGDYRVFAKKVGWYFCKDCGVRVFGMRGEWEQVEVDVAEWAGDVGAGDIGAGDKGASKDEGKKKQKGWMTREPAASTGDKHYLSVNAVTLEPSEEIDLIKWHEKGWVFYVQSRTGDGMRLKPPFEYGMY